MGIALHGLLDHTPHSYPLRSNADVALASMGFLALAAALKGRAQTLWCACFFGCVFPDIVDLGPQILNRRLGVSLPVFRFFLWHQPRFSGSIYDGSRAVHSLLAHVSVTALSLAAIAFRARGRLRP